MTDYLSGLKRKILSSKLVDNSYIHASVEDFQRSPLLLRPTHLITGQEIPRPLPGAGVEELEGDGRTTVEEGNAFAAEDGEEGEMQFVDQVVQDQVVPEDAPHQHQELAARLGFEGGDLLDQIRHADDAGVVIGG